MALMRKDPYLAFNFLVVIGGIEAGGFSEVSGLRTEMEVHDYREGGQNEYIHKLAGPIRYPNNLTLKRGMADLDLLWAWYQTILQGIHTRQNITILLLDSARVPKRGWSFSGAYPVRWIGPQLTGSRSEVAVETLEFVHHGLLIGL
jgi:phage tail-like protein